MKKATKNTFITIAIILVITIIAFFILTKKPVSTDSVTAKCIGSKSILYVQLGCSHCKDQEDMFGENYQYLNVTDCFYQRDACVNENITGTPTWIIDGQQHIGVQTIEQLKTLTGC
jgi:glutaredoxin